MKAATINLKAELRILSITSVFVAEDTGCMPAVALSDLTQCNVWTVPEIRLRSRTVHSRRPPGASTHQEVTVRLVVIISLLDVSIN